MKKDKLKELAKSIAQEKSISREVEKFLLSLSRANLKFFARQYREELKRNSTYITSASQLNADSVKELEGIFKNKRLIADIDESLGAGIRIEDNDNIIDFTFKKYINDTIDMLK